MIQSAAFRILYCFRESNARNFVELCEQAGYSPDLGGYYIRQLVRSGYLDKQERGVYAVTVKGKQVIAKSIHRKLTVERPRLVVILVANQAGNFIVLRRKVQPFIGVAEWPARSVLYGRSMQAEAATAAQVRLGVAAQPEFVGMFRRIDMYNDEVFDDKLFAVHQLHISATHAVQSETADITGTVEHHTSEELRTIERPARSLLDIFAFVSENTYSYSERVYRLTASDLDI